MLIFGGGGGGIQYRWDIFLPFQATNINNNSNTIAHNHISTFFNFQKVLLNIRQFYIRIPWQKYCARMFTFPKGKVQRLFVKQAYRMKFKRLKQHSKDYDWVLRVVWRHDTQHHSFPCSQIAGEAVDHVGEVHMTGPPYTSINHRKPGQCSRHCRHFRMTNASHVTLVAEKEQCCCSTPMLPGQHEYPVKHIRTFCLQRSVGLWTMSC